MPGTGQNLKSGLTSQIRMIDNLIGRPTADVVSRFAQTRPEVATFSVGGYDHTSYEGEPILKDLVSLWQRKIKNSGWVDEVRRGTGARYIAITSGVQEYTGNTEYHIPMLDADDGSDERAREALKVNLGKLDMPAGVIISSGRGLHYMGLRPITNEQFNTVTREYGRKFDSHPDDWAELPGIDREWLYISKKRGFFALRLTPDLLFGQPVVVDTYRAEDFPEVPVPAGKVRTLINTVQSLIRH